MHLLNNFCPDSPSTWNEQRREIERSPFSKPAPKPVRIIRSAAASFTGSVRFGGPRLIFQPITVSERLPKHLYFYFSLWKTSKQLLSLHKKTSHCLHPELDMWLLLLRPKLDASTPSGTLFCGQSLNRKPLQDTQYPLLPILTRSYDCNGTWIAPSLILDILRFGHILVSRDLDIKDSISCFRKSCWLLKLTCRGSGTSEQSASK